MKVFAFALVFVLAQGGGCNNPNGGGVQDFGSVVGRVLDATNNRPVPNALVAVGALYTGYANPDGAFTLSGIPIGRQAVSASAPGYATTNVTVLIHKDATTNAYYVRLLPLTGGPTAPPPPTPTPTAGPATPTPVLSPEPSPSTSPAP
jgi:hypothetical protein